MTEPTPDPEQALDQLPVTRTEWRELHRLLGITSARLLPTDQKLEDVENRSDALAFGLTPTVPATLAHQHMDGRWTITHVRISGRGLEVIVERRMDGSRRVRRAVPISAITHVEQAIR